MGVVEAKYGSRGHRCVAGGRRPTSTVAALLHSPHPGDIFSFFYMERVQYSLERTLPQLRVLDEYSLLTRDELRSVTSQRQDFEARLIRRKAIKDDFVNYLAFEHDLNALIVLRARARAREAAERAREGDQDRSKHLPRTFFSRQAAAYSAQCVAIFERLVRKFRWDVDAWERYLTWAKSRKMRVVAGRVYARALALHPTRPALWLAAADYELNGNADTTAARALLQRALRMNKLTERVSDESKMQRTLHGRAAPKPSPRWDLTEYEQDVLRLWVEYVRMELVFLERLRRRWRVLGVDIRANDDEAAADAAVAADVPEAAAEEAAAEEPAPAELPAPSHVVDGAIPLVLLTSARTALPAHVQHYFFLAVLMLLSAFPFVDSVAVRGAGEIVSLRTSQTPLGTGDALRSRLVRGVYEGLEAMCAVWSEAGEVFAHSLTSLDPFLHPFSEAGSFDVRALPASAAAEELESHGLLHGASRLHTAFSPPLDGQYALATVPAAAAALAGERVAEAYDPWSAVRGVLLLLRLVSSRLVWVEAAEARGKDEVQVDVEDIDETLDAALVQRHPTPLLAFLTRGDLPSFVQRTVSAFRSVDEPLAFLATLRCLENSARSGIDESNLLTYLAHADAKVVAALRDDPAHAWLAVAELSRACTERAGLLDEAAVLAQRAQPLPGACVLYERLAQAAGAAPWGFSWAEDSAADASGAAVAAWDALLTACTSVEAFAHDAVPVWGVLVAYMGTVDDAASDLPAEAALVAAGEARQTLWLEYLDWVQHAASVPDDHAAASEATRWAWALYQRAVVRTGALLASSQLVGAPRARAQALHDAVVRRLYTFGASLPATRSERDADNVGRDRALAYALSHSSASTACWLALAEYEAARVSAGITARGGAPHARTMRMYTRATAQAARDGAPVDAWAAYLGYLAHTQGDMRAALRELPRAIEHVRASLGTEGVAALEARWRAMVQ